MNFLDNNKMNKIRKDDIQKILNENLPYKDLQNKTILISGASGFIPSYIVDTLLMLGQVKVIALIRNLEKAKTKFKHWENNPNLISSEN